jgi:hypothetical protein
MEQNIDRMNWLRDLVKAEDQMEESGVVDFRIGFENDQFLFSESVAFLLNLKHEFIEASNYFNELKHSAVGRIKIYGIAKTHADFMLFRNGYKMIFTLPQPGVISIRFNFLGPSQFIPNTVPTANQNSATSLMEEHLIEAHPGPFADLVWTYKANPIKADALVKYHMSLFIRESAK